METRQLRKWPFSLELSSSVLIHAPRQPTWEAFRNIERWPVWSRVCLGVWGIAGGPWRAGGQLSFKLRIAGVSVSFSVNVIEALPTQRVVWASTVLGLTATRTFTFDGHSGTTIVTDRKTFESPLIPVRLVYPRPVIRLMTESWLNDLKAESERLAQRRSSLM